MIIPIRNLCADWLADVSQRTFLIRSLSPSSFSRSNEAKIERQLKEREKLYYGEFAQASLKCKTLDLSGRNAMNPLIPLGYRGTPGHKDASEQT